MATGCHSGNMSFCLTIPLARSLRECQISLCRHSVQEHRTQPLGHSCEFGLLQWHWLLLHGTSFLYNSFYIDKQEKVPAYLLLLITRDLLFCFRFFAKKN